MTCLSDNSSGDEIFANVNDGIEIGDGLLGSMPVESLSDDF